MTVSLRENGLAALNGGRESLLGFLFFRDDYIVYYEKQEANRVEAPDSNSEKMGSIPMLFLLFLLHQKLSER